MTTTNLVARYDRMTGDLDLFDNGIQFGRLANCEICHVFVSPDEELAERINASIEGDMSRKEALSVIRQIYLSLLFDRKAESESEILAEGAWLRAAEYDPEAFDEMAREDLR